MPLKVTVEEKAGGAYVILQPEGSIDANTYTILAAEVEAVLKKSATLLIFNLERVGFVSSAGIGVVLAAEKAMKTKGGKALMVNLKPQIRKVFYIVQALPSKHIFSCVVELDAYLAEMQRQVREGPPQ
jgi:anti-sigma B factor antagonist